MTSLVAVPGQLELRAPAPNSPERVLISLCGGTAKLYFYIDGLGIKRSLLTSQHTRRGILRLFAGCDEFLVELWPRRLRHWDDTPDWDHDRAAEDLIGRNAKLQMVDLAAMERRGFPIPWKRLRGL
jgi:hypothetical protein